MEKDVTLAISQELKRLLLATQRVRVALTRNDDRDIPLQERSKKANDDGAKFFLSIHANASLSARSEGVETYFLSTRASSKRARQLARRENEGIAFPTTPSTSELATVLKQLRHTATHQGSQRMAINIQKTLANALDARNRGVLQAPFVVLQAPMMPAVLVEVGFLSHQTECQLLGQRTYQHKVAAGLMRSILLHLASEKSTTTQQDIATVRQP